MEALLIVWLLFVLIAITVSVILLVVVVKSAKQKGRSSVLWFFLSLCFTPIFCLFILFCIGMTDEKRRELIVEEEKLRLKVNEGLQNVEEESVEKECFDEEDEGREVIGKTAGGIVIFLLLVILFIVIISLLNSHSS